MSRILVRAELFKIYTSRWQRASLVLVLLVHVPPLLLWGGQSSPEATWNGLRARSGLLAGYALLTFGVIIVCQEYRHRTVALTWLVTPARRRVLAAQAAAVTVAGVPLCTVLLAAWTAVGAARHGGAAVHADAPGDLLGAYGVVVVTVGAAGVLGVSVGALTRSSTAALLALSGCAMVELASDRLRFHGPVTSILGVLAWPTSEDVTTSLVAAVCWAAAAFGVALAAVGRDLAAA
jgi:hypothetical protein